MNKIKLMIITLVSVFSLSALIAPAPVFAVDCSGADDCVNNALNIFDPGGKDTKTVDGAIKSIADILLFVLGAIAVIMIIIGGIKYTTSNGDEKQITSAKNTILYSVVGLVVAILAYAIVRFVIDQI